MATVLSVVFEGLRGGSMREAAVEDGAHHGLSTSGREAGIVVDVHSVPGVKSVCRNFSFPGPDRMDNLLKAHI